MIQHIPYAMARCCICCGSTIPKPQRIYASLRNGLYSYIICDKPACIASDGRPEVHKAAQKYLTTCEKGQKFISSATSITHKAIANNTPPTRQKMYHPPKPNKRAIGITKPSKARKAQMNRIITQLLNAQDGRCAITGEILCIEQVLPYDPQYRSIEHVIPRCLGGRNDITNYVITAHEANSKRQANSMRLHHSIPKTSIAHLGEEARAYLALSPRRQNRASARQMLRSHQFTSQSGLPLRTWLIAHGIPEQSAEMLICAMDLQPSWIQGWYYGIRKALSLWIAARTTTHHNKTPAA